MNKVDLSDIRGLKHAKRAMEIAVAGNHNLLFIGSPGSGKTMLARRMTTLLPPMVGDDAVEVDTVRQLAGMEPLAGFRERPFRAPHHTASAAALIGGGDPVRPGEVTLAHGGVLFLDELPELRKPAVEVLLDALAKGSVELVRGRCRIELPARPLVVAAMNPCPCGYAGDPGRTCACTPESIARYQSRVSGPLLDLFDLHVTVPRTTAATLRDAEPGECSAVVRARVQGAQERLAYHEASFDPEAVQLRGVGANRGRTLRVARTIAALDARAKIARPHVAEALEFTP